MTQSSKPAVPGDNLHGPQRNPTKALTNPNKPRRDAPQFLILSVTPGIDQETGLVYVAMGNPVPHLYGDVREGTNLYAGSLIVLDVLA